MNQIYLKRAALTIALFVSFSTVAPLAFAQKAAKAPLVQERNVRAAMEFLASDAMQGRGSGTIYERIAAEYIGSQFQQFGLEPAGEKNASGAQTYLQTVEVPGRAQLKDVQFGGVPGNGLTFGKDIGAFSISAKDISGELQKIKFGDAVKKGAVVFVALDEADTFQSFRAKLGTIFQGGATAVILSETKETRENWESLAGQKPALSQRGSIFVVNKAAGDALSKLADGAKIEITATFSEPQKSNTWNAAGKITGSDAKLGAEVVLISSHLDHVGVRENAKGDDKIFNGADDDASGTVAVLELARALAAGPKPKRTVYFVCFGSEEAGGHGSRYFADNLPFPQEKFVANLQFEMIGRPDAKVKPEELWLTGYERSNLGPELAKRGAKLVADPHPEQNFFQRSDNYTLARKGIIAHTVSSFGLHTDYHQPSDENDTIDFLHMTRAINSMVAPVSWLVNSNFVPAWNEGKKP
jgi:hypothetical protein